MSEPFEKGLRMVREALARTELSVTAELDVSDRIQRQLGLGLAPCRILLVDSPYLLLEAVALDRSAAVLLPLHVVVAGRGTQTVMHCLNPPALAGAELPAGTAAPLARLQTQLERVLESVAIRQDSYQPAV